MRSGQCCLRLDIIDLVLAQQESHAFGELIGSFAAACNHPFKIEANFSSFDPMLSSCAPNQFHRLGGIEKSLRRNAAPVEANPARQVALDHRNAHFELTCADSGDISTRARADNHKIVT